MIDIGSLDSTSREGILSRLLQRLPANVAIGLGLISLVSGIVVADTGFYVDSSRTSSGNGTAASPWKLISDIGWTTISNSLRTNAVTLYLSSRGSWSPPNQVFAPAAYGNAAYRLSIIGDALYNTNASGTAAWTAEIDNTHRAKLTGGCNFAAPWSANDGPGFTYVNIRGLYIDHPANSGMAFITKISPATNVHDIYITNCVIDSPANNIGISFSEHTIGCSNWVISGCIISNSPGECIYVGKYDWLTDAITGVIIESNLCVNCGLTGEGDIDIKPPCYGAIIRYNQHFHTFWNSTNTECGVVIGADNCQVYGNIFHHNPTNKLGQWGNGIYLNADGDAQTGKAITACLIYNNLIYQSGQHGIKVTATTATANANISGVKIWNNTVIGNNIGNGIALGAGNGRTVTIAQIYNNIVAFNTNADLATGTGVTISACDYNVYYRPNGYSWTVNGIGKTWAQWQALGYDIHGVNADPLFMISAGLAFSLQPASPARNAGVPSGFFTEDLLQRSRPVSAWDAGAIQNLSPVASPRLLRVVSPQ